MIPGGFSYLVRVFLMDRKGKRKPYSGLIAHQSLGYCVDLDYHVRSGREESFRGGWHTG